MDSKTQTTATPVEYIEAVLVVKGWLRKYRECILDIDVQDERIKRITNRLESASSPKLTEMPKSPSQSTDRITDMIAQRDRLLEASKDQRIFARKTQDRLDKLLNVCTPRERNIIQLHDMDGMEFGDIIPIVLAKEIKEGMKYVQCQSYVYRYRRRGILKLAKTLKDSDGTVYPTIQEIQEILESV